MLRRKLNNPVTKIVVIGSLTLSSIGLILRQKIENRMRNTTSYQEAIKILHSEEFCKQYLGEPIVEHALNFLSSNSHGSDGKFRWIMFGVEGPKQKGFFKYWFSSDNEGNHKLLRVTLLNTTEQNIFDRFIIPKKDS